MFFNVRKQGLLAIRDFVAKQMGALSKLLIGKINTAVPLGGTAGQVLAKKSADDHATEWVDPSADGGDNIEFITISLEEALSLLRGEEKDSSA